MSALSLAEFTTVLAAKEVTPGTLAAANWKTFQVNPGGLGSFKADVTRIRRNFLSKNRQMEAGDDVNLKSAPSITQDMTKDFVDYWADAMFLSSGKHTGNTGLAYFKPTAVTATGFTVAASGALTNNFLIRSRGWQTAANNGVKVCAGTSIGTEIKCTGLVAESLLAGTTPIVEVCGWQGAAGDIGIDVNGNLTSAASVFTGWNLTPGQEIFVGGDLVSNGGLAAESFANAAYRGVAKVKSVTAALVTLERRAWTVGAADPGTSKTIRIWFGKFWRNVAADHADSLTGEAVQPSYSLEASTFGAGAAAATSYLYPTGCMVNTAKFDAPNINKIEATLQFEGRDFLNPTTTRATGAATAEQPIQDATSIFNTVDNEQYLRIANKSDDSSLLVDIDSWSLTLSQNITPQNQQGTYGAKRMIVGKFTVGIDVKGYYVQDDAPKAIRDSRLVTFGSMVRNADGAVFFDVPNVQLSGGDMDWPENGPVTISTMLEASRETMTYSTTMGLSTFPYAPLLV